MLWSALTDFHVKYPDKKFVIAFSGGLDSRVLLDFCVRLRAEYPIQCRVIHINHGLHQAANTWSAFCKETCKTLNLHYAEYLLSLEIAPTESVEAVARSARYNALKFELQSDEVLLTGHHLDDQSETFFLQLLRGSGLRGLSAMPAVRAFGRGYHFRPLLNLSRDTILHYAEQNNLEWIVDHTNADENFTRNFLRHQITPLLKQRNKNVDRVVARSAAHGAEAQLLLDEYAMFLMTDISAEHDTLRVDKLLNLSNAQQRLVIRYWLYSQGHPLPTSKKLENILQNVLPAAADRLPCVRWLDREVRRFQNRLYVVAIKSNIPSKGYRWNPKEPLSLHGVGQLSVDSLGQSLPEELYVDFRRGGEKLKINGCHKTLKNMLQEWAVPPWLRSRLPLVYLHNRLIAVVGFWAESESGLLFKLDEEGISPD